MSTFIDPATRLSLITGTSYNTFQIPNTPGQPVGMNGNPPSPTRPGSRISIRRCSTRTRGSTPSSACWRCKNPTQRLRRPIVLFHPLQQSALHSGPGRRPAAQRHRLGHQPAILYQRHSGRRLVCDQRGAYAARRLYRQRRKDLGRQYLAGRGLRSGCDGTDKGRRRIRSPTTSPSSAGSPASTSRTSGRSPAS